MSSHVQRGIEKSNFYYLTQPPFWIFPLEGAQKRRYFTKCPLLGLKEFMGVETNHFSCVEQIGYFSKVGIYKYHIMGIWRDKMSWGDNSWRGMENPAKIPRFLVGWIPLWKGINEWSWMEWFEFILGSKIPHLTNQNKT